MCRQVGDTLERRGSYCFSHIPFLFFCFFFWFITPFIRVTTSGEAQSTEVLHDYPARSPPLKEQAFKTPESAQHRPRRHGSYCFKAALLAPASSSRGSWQKRTEMSMVTMQMLWGQWIDPHKVQRRSVHGAPGLTGPSVPPWLALSTRGLSD